MTSLPGEGRYNIYDELERLSKEIADLKRQTVEISVSTTVQMLKDLKMAETFLACVELRKQGNDHT